MPDKQAIIHGACTVPDTFNRTNHTQESQDWYYRTFFLWFVAFSRLRVCFCYHAFSLHISLSVFYPWFSFPLRPFSICRLLLWQNWCGLSFHVSVLCLTNVGFVQSFSLKSFQACVLGLWYSVMFMLRVLSGLCGAFSSAPFTFASLSSCFLHSIMFLLCGLV